MHWADDHDQPTPPALASRAQGSNYANIVGSKRAGTTRLGRPDLVDLILQLLRLEGAGERLRIGEIAQRPCRVEVSPDDLAERRVDDLTDQPPRVERGLEWPGPQRSQRWFPERVHQELLGLQVGAVAIDVEGVGHVRIEGEVAHGNKPWEPNCLDDCGNRGGKLLVVEDALRKCLTG